MNTNEYVSLIIAISAMLISLITLIYTIKTFLFKNGIHITGYCTISSSVYCNDAYVSKIVLENKKDKSVIIYRIYLQVAYNNFILLENFKTKPLILGPFEAFSKEYDPIERYEANLEWINLNKLLTDTKIRKHIILSTAEGKYKVKKVKDSWDPVVKSFKNLSTTTIEPFRITYKDKSYGSNVQYILDFEGLNGEHKIIPIYHGDNRFKFFRNFELPSESLKSKETLEELLTHEKELGNIMCKSFKVIYLDHTSRFNEDNHYIEIKYINWFTYNIIGRIKTIIFNRNVRKNISKQINSKRH